MVGYATRSHLLSLLNFFASADLKGERNVEFCRYVAQAEQAILKKSNRQLLLSSEDAGWHGIRFLFTRSLGAGALPEEIFFQGDVIHIYTDMPSGYFALRELMDGGFKKALSSRVIVSSFLVVWLIGLVIIKKLR